MRRARVLVGSLLMLAFIAGAVLAFVAWREQAARVWTDGRTIRAPAADASPRRILWAPPRALAAPINTDTDEYEPRVSGNGQWMFFVRGRAGLNADLYIAERTLDGWGEPSPLEGLNTSEFDELGPCPSWDGSVLYFASNRTGGEGGYDLWRAERREDGTWLPPENLGAGVNSPFDEYGPALASDERTLVFSSNRPSTESALERAEEGEANWDATLRRNVGRAPFDLYRVALEGDDAHAGAAEAEVIAALTSPADEGAAVFSPAGDFLYFASNREGGAGGFDLYRARMRGDVFGDPESLGSPINTEWNELDPALWQDGFAIIFSREVVSGVERERTYDLFESESREVFAERDLSLAAIDWSRWLPAIWWLLVLLALLLLLLFLWRQIQNERLSLLVRCLLASALLHCLILLLLSVWEVTTGLSEIWQEGRETRIALTTGSAEHSLAAQVRGAMQSPVELPMLAVVDARPFTRSPQPDAEPAPSHADFTPTLREVEHTPAPLARDHTPAAAHPTPPTGIERDRTVEPIAMVTEPATLEALRMPQSMPRELRREESIDRPPTDVPTTDAAPRPTIDATMHEGDAPAPMVDVALSNGDDRHEPVEAEPSPAIDAAAPTESAPVEMTALPERDLDSARASEPVLSDAASSESLPLPAESPITPVDDAGPIEIPPVRASSDGGAHRARSITTDESTEPPVAMEVHVGAPAQDDPVETIDRPSPTLPLESAVTSDVPARPAAEVPLASRDETLLAVSTVSELALPGEEPLPESSESADAVIVIASPTIPASDERLEARSTDDGAPEIEAIKTSVDPAIERPESAMRGLEMEALEHIEATPERPESVDRDRFDVLLALEAHLEGDVLLEVPTDDFVEQAPAQTLRISPPAAPSIQYDRTRAAMIDEGDDHSAHVELLSPIDQPVQRAGATAFDREHQASRPEIRIPSAREVEGDFSSALTALVEPTIPTEAIPAYRERLAPNRLELVKERGGSDATERAVQAALRWLAAHQDADGSWSAQHFDDECESCLGAGRYETDVATTGLSLLAFLGAGHTHFGEGEYQVRVQRAIDWLSARQRPNGDLRAGETMYSHGIAAIALSEAYGMTRDEALRPIVERAIRFIVEARHDDSGGWRYEPGQFGDTSVFGWQIMALISAQRAGIELSPDVNAHARRWLDRVAHDRFPGRYAYQPGQPFSPAMTAEAMFCQQLLGRSPEEPRMIESAEYLIEHPPVWDRQASTYYWYYATLALYQHGGEAWSAWNGPLTQTLLANQRTDGPAAGSWDPIDRWAVIGGRVYQTALAALMLEVYYRYLPLYEQAGRVESSGNP